MRKILLIAAIAVLGTAGAAYGATVVTNVYVLSGKITPKKSGTKAHPVPFGATEGYTVSTKPKGERPNVVKGLVITISGVRANTNDFPPCGTSLLNSKGPAGCPKGSLVGTGTSTAEIGAASSQSGNQTTCQIETNVYDGGGHSLTYYVYATKAAGQCPLPSPAVFAATLAERGGALVETITIPFSLRHPLNNTALDGVLTKTSLTFPVKTTTLKSKKVKGKTVKGKKVGLFEAIACPANHKRHVTTKFTLENGKATFATLNLACS